MGAVLYWGPERDPNLENYPVHPFPGICVRDTLHPRSSAAARSVPEKATLTSSVEGGDGEPLNFLNLVTR